PVKAMVDKRGVKANRANLQKAREVMAKRKAAEAKAKAHAGAAEAEAQAQARAGENGAQAKAEAELLLRPRLRPKLMLRGELQRKDQQLADLVAKQQAILLEWEQQLTEQKQQL
ncbi:hypothetical protein QJQ45_016333, partial [Haematococcus lacustris]